MSDLQTMFNNGMGSFAAIQMGRQSAEEQQKAEAAAQMQQALLQKQQLENQQSQSMNPLDLMFKRGQVDQQAATLPGVQAQSDSLQTKAQNERSTQASDVAAMISKNKAQMSADDFKEMQQDAHKMIQSAALLEQVPVMQRPAALRNIGAQYGIGADSPFLKQFMETDPNRLPQALRDMGQGMALASEQYIMESAKQKEKNTFDAGQNELDRKNRSSIAGGNNATALEVAKIAAQSRLDVSKNATAARAALSSNKPMSTDQKFAALSSIPEEERTPSEQQQLELISKQRITERSAGINPMAAQMLGTQSAIASAQAQSPVVAPAYRQPTPATSPEDAQLAQALQAQGMPYEPTKYMYRMGPNGQIQRKAK